MKELQRVDERPQSGEVMSMSRRFRSECGPFIMEVTGVETGWIARVDGAGEHYKATWPDEGAAKDACLEAAKTILSRKSTDWQAPLAEPLWV